ncbi:MAG: hypothetical protein QM775_05430 [Pirellulales bacterium]
MMVEAAHKTATDVLWIISDNPAITEIVSGAFGRQFATGDSGEGRCLRKDHGSN